MFVLFVSTLYTFIAWAVGGGSCLPVVHSAVFWCLWLSCFYVCLLLLNSRARRTCLLPASSFPPFVTNSLSLSSRFAKCILQSLVCSLLLSFPAILVILLAQESTRRSCHFTFATQNRPAHHSSHTFCAPHYRRQMGWCDRDDGGCRRWIGLFFKSCSFTHIA